MMANLLGFTPKGDQILLVQIGKDLRFIEFKHDDILYRKYSDIPVQINDRPPAVVAKVTKSVDIARLFLMGVSFDRLYIDLALVKRLRREQDNKIMITWDAKKGEVGRGI